MRAFMLDAEFQVKHFKTLLCIKLAMIIGMFSSATCPELHVMVYW